MSLPEERRTLLLDKWKPVSACIFVHDLTVPAVMLAQISFFIFAWTFSGFMIRKTIPLPDSKAMWMRNNPSDTQVIVTVVSTIFALLSSSLLSKAMQYALVRRLACGPLHLATMVEWAKLAQRSLSLNGPLSWTLLSALWVALLGFLTTAWSTLLAPESILINYDFQSNQINFLNPSVSNLFWRTVQPPPFAGFNLDPTKSYTYIDTYTDWMTPLTTSAFSMAYTNTHGATNLATDLISVPATSYACNISTGGISPAVIYSGIGNLLPSYRGLSRTYNVTQQGFTANVFCRLPTSGDPVIVPDLTNSILISGNDHGSWIMDTYAWTVNCSSEIEHSTFGVPFISGISESGRLLMTSVCFGQGFTGPSNQSFLVLFSASRYSYWNEICEVTPLVTTVRTIYDETGIINVLRPPLYQHPLPDPTSTTGNTGILLWFPAYMIWYTFVRSQGLTTNTIGDDLMGIGRGYVDSPLLEVYLRGMVEYLGTIMATGVSLEIGPDMTVQLNGTVNARTFGWSFHPRTHGPALIAITLVTILTVAAGFFAMIPVNSPDGASEVRKRQAPLLRAFNPTGTMDVLLASSTGDLLRTLSESSGAYRRALASKHSLHDRHGVDGMRVVLETTDEGWPVLRTVGIDVMGDHANTDFDSSSLLLDRNAALITNGSSTDVCPGDGYIELEEVHARTMSSSQFDM